jgi:hypothetical protein
LTFLRLNLFLKGGNPPRRCDDTPPVADGEPTPQHVISERAQSRPDSSVKEFHSIFDRDEFWSCGGRVNVIGTIQP